MSNKDDLSEFLPTKLGLPELVKKANTGDQASLAQLRRTLDENPQIWRAVGNLAQHARMVLVDAIAGKDQLAKDSLLRHADEMEKDLAGPSPSPLERLTAGRIVACWLETHYAALQGPEPTGNTLKHAKFVLQIKESAEKRFHAAIKSLSLIRKMLPSSATTGAKPGQNAAGADAPVPDRNGTVAAAANGSTNSNGSRRRRSIPPVVLADTNGQNGSVPANRISKHLPEKINGHVDRLQVFSEDAVLDEKRETQPV